MSRVAPVADGPRGFRVVRGVLVLGPWLCPACPERTCGCYEAANKAMKAAGAPARLETLDGVKLAEMKPTTGGRPVRMLSLAEHRAQPRRASLSVDEVADEDDPLEEPTDEAGGDDVDESVDDAGDDE